MSKVISGQTTVATAGTAVALGSQDVLGSLAICALAGNTGNVYIGNDGSGDVTSSNGYEMAPGNQIILVYVGNLNDVIVDAATSNDKVSWLILG